jgi:hypothetical protein
MGLGEIQWPESHGAGLQPLEGHYDRETWNFGFHNTFRHSWVADWVATSHEGLSSMGYFSISGLTTRRYTTPWPQSASELYRQNDNRLSLNLVPTFWGHMVLRDQSNGSLRPESRFSSQEEGIFNWKWSYDTNINGANICRRHPS